MSEIAEDTQEAHHAQVEEINQQIEDAGLEVVEIKEYTWSLGIPGKPDIPCSNYEDWAKQYEELAGKVARSKLDAEARLKKLEDLKQANVAMFGRLKMEQSLQHTKQMVARRTQVEAEAKSA